MKLHHVTGCTANSLNVDGKEEIDLTNEERIAVIDEIHKWMVRHPECLNYIMQDLTGLYGESHFISDTPCECCGDYVEESILDLDK